MYIDSANVLSKHKLALSLKISKWVEEHHPERTTEYDKCERDIGYIINSIENCLRKGNHQSIDYIGHMFYKGDKLQLKSVDVEFLAYDKLNLELQSIISNVNACEFIETLINKLKEHLNAGFQNYIDNPFKARLIDNIDRETTIKRMFYSWDQEMDIVRNMQKCQRNWDYSQPVSDELADYLLWHAENSPSKQHEAYYDVYWSNDRNVIDECSKYTWGSTHSRTPPSTWRNTQANANMYMLFVAKEPETQLNCHSDGTPKENKDTVRWENAYVSIGIAMGLVMRAANAIGLVTGCNKSHGDLNGDMFWERKLGIEEDVLAGRKKIAYGIGIGHPQHDRPRWETDDYELAIGAGNGSKLTTDPDMDVHPVTGKPMRKVKIVDIRTTDKAVDPYGNEHILPTESSIKINTMRKRIINITKIK